MLPKPFYSQPRASDDEPYEHFWYIGLKFDVERMKKDKRKGPNLTQPIADFKRRLLDWKRRKDGMSLFVTSKKQKDLPDFVLHPDKVCPPTPTPFPPPPPTSFFAPYSVFTCET